MRNKYSLLNYLKFENEAIDSAICNGDGKSCKCVLYLVGRNIDREKCIYIYLLNTNENGQWDYQSMSEHDKPEVYNCPKRILLQSQVDDRNGWRAECIKRQGLKPL